MNTLRSSGMALRVSALCRQGVQPSGRHALRPTCPLKLDRRQLSSLPPSASSLDASIKGKAAHPSFKPPQDDVKGSAAPPQKPSSRKWARRGGILALLAFAMYEVDEHVNARVLQRNLRTVVTGAQIALDYKFKFDPDSPESVAALHERCASRLLASEWLSSHVGPSWHHETLTRAPLQLVRATWGCISKWDRSLGPTQW